MYNAFETIATAKKKKKKKSCQTQTWFRSLKLRNRPVDRKIDTKKGLIVLITKKKKKKKQWWRGGASDSLGPEHTP